MGTRRLDHSSFRPSSPEDKASPGIGKKHIVSRAEQISDKVLTSIAGGKQIESGQIEVEFDRKHFLEFPEWGLSPAVLPVGPPVYQAGSVYATMSRVLESLSSSGLTIDRKLAYAACVSSTFCNKFCMDCLRKVVFKPSSGEITTSFGGESYDKSGQEDRVFSYTPEDVLAFHIPSLVGISDPSSYEFMMASNPQEALWKMIIESENDGLTFDFNFVCGGGTGENAWYFVVMKDQYPLLRIPISDLPLPSVDSLQLSENEIRLKQVSDTVDPILKQIKDFSPEVDRIHSYWRSELYRSNGSFGLLADLWSFLNQTKKKYKEAEVVYGWLMDYLAGVGSLKKSIDDHILFMRVLGKRRDLDDQALDFLSKIDEQRETGVRLIARLEKFLSKYG